MFFVSAFALTGYIWKKWIHGLFTDNNEANFSVLSTKRNAIFLCSIINLNIGLLFYYYVMPYISECVILVKGVSNIKKNYYKPMETELLFLPPEWQSLT